MALNLESTMKIWIIMSIIAMLANISKVLYVKLRCTQIDSWLLIFYARLFPAIILGGTLFFIDYEITHPLQFWLTTLTTTLLTLLASILYLDSLKRGYLSIVVPIQAAIPLFMVACTATWYQEVPPLISFSFILIIVGSIAITLILTHPNQPPVEAKLFSAGVLKSIAAAILFGISTVLDRIAIASVTHGGLVYSAYWHITTSIILLPLIVFRPASVKQPQHFGVIFLYAILALIAFVFQQLAVQYSLVIDNGVTYVKSIVMIHISIVTIISIVLLKEKPYRWLLIASFLTFIGGLGLIMSI
jgi:drug/metabolite transporter (DMT)-like permease